MYSGRKVLQAGRQVRHLKENEGWSKKGCYTVGGDLFPDMVSLIVSLLYAT